LLRLSKSINLSWCAGETMREIELDSMEPSGKNSVYHSLSAEMNASCEVRGMTT
jgi:hypothetical protein